MSVVYCLNFIRSFTSTRFEKQLSSLFGIGAFQAVTDEEQTERLIHTNILYFGLG